MDKSKSVLKREAVQRGELLEVDKCREAFEKWYEDNGDHVEKEDYKAWCSYAFESGWKACQSENDRLIAEAGWK